LGLFKNKTAILVKLVNNQPTTKINIKSKNI
jgi:hypothetical protein